MRIAIVTPPPPGGPVGVGGLGKARGVHGKGSARGAGRVGGNQITSLRWARILRRLGHRVSIFRSDAPSQQAFPARFDLLIALHARKSHGAIAAFHKAHPERPIILAMTGTDLYGDLSKPARSSPSARRRGASAGRPALRSIALADRIVVLNPAGPRSLPRSARLRTRVVLQSVTLPAGLRSGRRSHPRPPFDVCVLGNLRPVKDPFRAALAARRLPPSSAIRILHVGSALDPRMEARARAEEARNPRYRWLGALGHAAALGRLARCRLFVLPSRMEGGANAIMEALALGVPVLCSRIPGSLGLLGDDYPGTFATGDTAALARLLLRAETDDRFYDLLRRRCARKKALTNPEREVRAWRSLLHELRS